MSMTLEVVRSQAFELSESDRRLLAHELLESCDEAETEEDEGMWGDLISQRLEAVERGEAVIVSHEDAMRKIDDALAKRRSS